MLVSCATPLGKGGKRALVTIHTVSLFSTRKPDKTSQTEFIGTCSAHVWLAMQFFAGFCFSELLYSGKFSRCSIFVDGPSLPFCGFNFCGCVNSCPLCTVQLSLFHGFNFCS